MALCRTLPLAVARLALPAILPTLLRRCFVCSAVSFVVLVLSFAATLLGVPGAPTQSQAANATSNSAFVSWTSPQASGVSVTSFQVLVYTVSGSGLQLYETVTVLAPALSTTLTNLQSHTTYNIQVCMILSHSLLTSVFAKQVAAVNSHGLSTASNAVVITTSPGPPSRLASAPTASNIKETSLTLSWAAPTNDGGFAVSSYQIFQQQDDGTFTPLQTTPCCDTSAVVSCLTAGTSYSFQVVASRVFLFLSFWPGSCWQLSGLWVCERRSHCDYEFEWCAATLFYSTYSDIVSVRWLLQLSRSFQPTLAFSLSFCSRSLAQLFSLLLAIGLQKPRLRYCVLLLLL